MLRNGRKQKEEVGRKELVNHVIEVDVFVIKFKIENMNNKSVGCLSRYKNHVSLEKNLAPNYCCTYVCAKRRNMPL